MIREDQYAGLIMSHKSLQKECEEWKRKYYEVADAITRESFGVEDLCAQARAIRHERDRLADEARWYKTRHELLLREQKRFGEGKARTMLCDILANGQMLPEPDRYPNGGEESHAMYLLRRWERWATAHGHDVGMRYDTRAFLSLPNV